MITTGKWKVHRSERRGVIATGDTFGKYDRVLQAIFCWTQEKQTKATNRRKVRREWNIGDYHGKHGKAISMKRMNI